MDSARKLVVVEHDGKPLLVFANEEEAGEMVPDCTTVKRTVAELYRVLDEDSMPDFTPAAKRSFETWTAENRMRIGRL